MNKIPPSMSQSLHMTVVNVLHKLNGVYAARLFLFMPHGSLSEFCKGFGQVPLCLSNVKKSLGKRFVFC